MSVKILLLVFLITLSCGSSLCCVNPPIEDLILLNFYITPTQVQVFNVHSFHQILSHASFLRNRNTVIYHYGFSQTPTTPAVAEVIQAYLGFGDVNFILVNYESVATNIATNACSMGESLAAALIRFFREGYESSRVHLVGFSFGASVWGIAGREVLLQSNGDFTIERITGLDPGQIEPALLPLMGRIGPGDARFVETIHTEAVGFGDLEALGDVQYFVNGGITQPMCTSNINVIAQTCSHIFASTIWAESIRANSPIFPALQCQSWQHFLNNDCKLDAPIGNLGVLTSTSLRGSYFLRTNLEAPFSRAVPGP